MKLSIMYEILSKIHKMATRDTVWLQNVICFTLPSTNLQRYDSYEILIFF
jgi:hypothetical protein